MLGLFATYFLGEQIGKHSDDYFLGQRDVVTGEIVRYTLGDIDHKYWRPLHCIFTAGLQTILWNHDWAVHLVLTLTHIASALLLGEFLRQAGLGWRSAATAGVLFLVCPVAFEAFFWSAAWMTIWANMIFLGLAIMQVQYARKVHRPRWPWLLSVLMIGHAIPCANEQAMMGVLALPLLSLAVAPEHQSWRERWWRALSMPVAAGIGGLVYVVLMLWTLQPGQRGEAGSMAVVELWPERAWLITRGAWSWLTLSHFGKGAIQTGLRELAASPWRAGVAAAVLGAAVVWFGRAWIQHREPCMRVAVRRAGARFRPAWLIAFGVAVVTLDWCPIVLMRIYEAAPRLWYCPLAGLLIAMAAMFELVRRQVPEARHRGWTAVGAAALVAVSLMGAVALIGVQAMYRERWKLDQTHLSELRRLVPDPTAGSVVLPLEVLCTPMHTGSRRFDRAAESPLSNPFVAPIFVRRAFGRADVTAARPGGWGDPQIIDADQKAGRWRRDHWNGTTGSVRIPWRLIILVRIDADGRMHVVSSVRIERGGVESLVRELPQVGAAEADWTFSLP